MLLLCSLLIPSVEILCCNYKNVQEYFIASIIMLSLYLLFVFCNSSCYFIVIYFLCCSFICFVHKRIYNVLYICTYIYDIFANLFALFPAHVGVRYSLRNSLNGRFLNRYRMPVRYMALRLHYLPHLEWTHGLVSFGAKVCIGVQWRREGDLCSVFYVLCFPCTPFLRGKIYPNISGLWRQASW